MKAVDLNEESLRTHTTHAIDVSGRQIPRWVNYPKRNVREESIRSPL